MIPTKLGHEFFVVCDIRMVNLVRGKSIQVEGFRFSYLTDIFHPKLERSPDSFIDIESCGDYSSGIIDSYEQTSFSPTVLEPEMITSIVLDHLAIVCFTLSHQELFVWFLLLLCYSYSSPKEFVAYCGHAECDSMFFGEFFLYHHIGVVRVVSLDERDGLVIFRSIVSMI